MVKTVSIEEGKHDYPMSFYALVFLTRNFALSTL